MLGMIVSFSFRMLDPNGYSFKNFLTLAVIKNFCDYSSTYIYK